MEKFSSSVLDNTGGAWSYGGRSAGGKGRGRSGRTGAGEAAARPQSLFLSWREWESAKDLWGAGGGRMGVGSGVNMTGRGY